MFDIIPRKDLRADNKTPVHSHRNTADVFVRALEAGSPRWSGERPLPCCELVSSHGGRGKEAFCGLFHKATNPNPEDSTFMT